MLVCYKTNQDWPKHNQELVKCICFVKSTPCGNVFFEQTQPINIGAELISDSCQKTYSQCCRSNTISFEHAISNKFIFDVYAEK